MAMQLEAFNLLDMRKSERQRLARMLDDATPIDLENLSNKIANTLSKFIGVFPENEEQIYLFGLDMRNLFAASELARSIPAFREHARKDVMLVFGGGFLGLPFRDTLDSLEIDRKKRRKEAQAQLADRRSRHQAAEGSMLKDLEELVAEQAASLVPPDIVVRR